MSEDKKSYLSKGGILADYYVHFSVLLKGPFTKEESRWLDAEYRRRGELSLEDPDVEDGGDFEFHVETDQRQDCWISSDGTSNVTHVVNFVQSFLKKFRPNSSFGMEWSYDCSRPRTDAYGGGAVFITANTAEWMHTHQWLEDMQKEFELSTGDKDGKRKRKSTG